MISGKIGKSIWLYHFGAASCNNCDIEILDTLTPRFDAERLGIKLIGSIRHADCMLVTGVVNSRSLPRLKEIYSQAPRPFYVAAVGTCSLATGIFKGSYNVEGPVDRHIPVDVYIPGCPPRPEVIISAMIKLIEKIEGEKKKGINKS